MVLTEELDYLNLFFIIKSYLHSNICKAYSIKTVFTDKDKKKKISESESMLTIKNMNYYQFYEWVNFRIKNDWTYNDSSDFYSFRILFERSIVKLLNEKEGLDVLEVIKPQYPWNKDWLNFFEKTIEREKILEKKIIYLENLVKKK